MYKSSVDVVSLITRFDDVGATDFESHATKGDSGGGVFHNSGGEWKLSGIMISSSMPDGQPINVAVFGNLTVSADLSVYRDHINAIMTVRAHKGPEETLAVPNEVLVDITSTPTFDATTPVLDGLVLSGRLDIIEDRNVLSAITEWNRWVTQALEIELLARDFLTNQLYPALAERGNLGGIVAEENLDSQISMRVDDEISGLVAYRVRLTALALSNLSSLRDAADGVLDAIDLAQAR